VIQQYHRLLEELFRQPRTSLRFQLLYIPREEYTVFTKIEFILNSMYGDWTAPFSAIKFIHLYGIFKWERPQRSNE
jgi:hypothetical protein